MGESAESGESECRHTLKRGERGKPVRKYIHIRTPNGVGDGCMYGTYRFTRSENGTGGIWARRGGVEFGNNEGGGRRDDESRTNQNIKTQFSSNQKIIIYALHLRAKQRPEKNATVQ